MSAICELACVCICDVCGVELIGECKIHVSANNLCQLWNDMNLIRHAMVVVMNLDPLFT